MIKNEGKTDPKEKNESPFLIHVIFLNICGRGG